MTPAPSAGSEGTKKKRRRRRPGNRAPQAVTTPTDGNSPAPKVQDKSSSNTPNKKSPERRPYAKRVDEVSAGGLVIDFSGTPRQSRPTSSYHPNRWQFACSKSTCQTLR